MIGNDCADAIAKCSTENQSGHDIHTNTDAHPQLSIFRAARVDPPPPACLIDALNTCQPGPPAYRPSILQTLLFLKKLCGLTFFLQTEVIHGLIRGFTLQDFPVSSVEISAFLGCHTILWVYLSGTDQAHSARTYHWRLERTWHFDTPWDSPFQQIYEDLSHILFGVPLGIVPGWWDDRERNHKPVLPLYLHLNISNNLSRALSCLHLSGHNFLVQRMRHNRNRRPYELRICDVCDWHTVQDHEEHILLDSPHEHSVSFHMQTTNLVNSSPSWG